jgi:putative phosphoesterase
MRVGLVADIHCNVAGLERALALMGRIDALICAGDAIYQFRFSNAVVRLLRDHGALAIQGNHEETFLALHGESARTDPAVEPELLAWLAARPTELRLSLGGRRVAVVHGSPWEPRKEYLYPKSAALARFAGFDAEVVVLGHTHHQMAQRVGATLLINPGSAGEARDARNGFQLSCAVWETESDTVQFLDFPDPTRVVAASSGASAWAAGHGGDGGEPPPGPDPWSTALGI